MTRRCYHFVKHQLYKVSQMKKTALESLCILNYITEEYYKIRTVLT